MAFVAIGMVAQATLSKETVKEDNIPDVTIGEMPADRILARMERSVEPSAWADWCRTNPAPFRLFGEDRQFAVRNGIIPAHWIAKGSCAAKRFRGVAQPGEFYPFQVCVVSEKSRKLRWSAYTALAFDRITLPECEVSAEGVKPIWVMVDIPKDAAGSAVGGKIEVIDRDRGEGRLLVCSFNFGDRDPAAAWLKARLEEYAGSDAFEPAVSLSKKQLAAVIDAPLLKAEKNANVAGNPNDPANKAAPTPTYSGSRRTGSEALSPKKRR